MQAQIEKQNYICGFNNNQILGESHRNNFVNKNNEGLNGVNLVNYNGIYNTNPNTTTTNNNDKLFFYEDVNKNQSSSNIINNNNNMSNLLNSNHKINPINHTPQLNFNHLNQISNQNFKNYNSERQLNVNNPYPYVSSHNLNQQLNNHSNSNIYGPNTDRDIEYLKLTNTNTMQKDYSSNSRLNDKIINQNMMNSISTNYENNNFGLQNSNINVNNLNLNHNSNMNYNLGYDSNSIQEQNYEYLRILNSQRELLHKQPEINLNTIKNSHVTVEPKVLVNRNYNLNNNNYAENHTTRDVELFNPDSKQLVFHNNKINVNYNYKTYNNINVQPNGVPTSQNFDKIPLQNSTRNVNSFRNVINMDHQDNQIIQQGNSIYPNINFNHSVNKNMQQNNQEINNNYLLNNQHSTNNNSIINQEIYNSQLNNTLYSTMNSQFDQTQNKISQFNNNQNNNFQLSQQVNYNEVYRGHNFIPDNSRINNVREQNIYENNYKQNSNLSNDIVNFNRNTTLNNNLIGENNNFNNFRLHNIRSDGINSERQAFGNMNPQMVMNKFGNQQDSQFKEFSQNNINYHDNVNQAYMSMGMNMNNLNLHK